MLGFFGMFHSQEHPRAKECGWSHGAQSTVCSNDVRAGFFTMTVATAVCMCLLYLILLSTTFPPRCDTRIPSPGIYPSLHGSTFCGTASQVEMMHGARSSGSLLFWRLSTSPFLQAFAQNPRRLISRFIGAMSAYAGCRSHGLCAALEQRHTFTSEEASMFASVRQRTNAISSSRRRCFLSVLEPRPTPRWVCGFYVSRPDC